MTVAIDTIRHCNVCTYTGLAASPDRMSPALFLIQESLDVKADSSSLHCQAYQTWADGFLRTPQMHPLGMMSLQDHIPFHND